MTYSYTQKRKQNIKFMLIKSYKFYEMRNLK